MAPPPFAFLGGERADGANVTIYAPEQPLLCPGDMLRYTIIGRVDAQALPLVVQSTARFMDVRSSRTVGARPALPSVPFLTPLSVTLTLTQAVPLDLAPGPYEYQSVVVAEAHAAAGYRVPFAVLPPEQCGKQRKRP